MQGRGKHKKRRGLRRTRITLEWCFKLRSVFHAWHLSFTVKSGTNIPDTSSRLIRFERGKSKDARTENLPLTKFCSNYIFCSLPEIFTATSINERLQIFTYFKGVILRKKMSSYKLSSCGKTKHFFRATNFSSINYKVKYKQIIKRARGYRHICDEKFPSN